MTGPVDALLEREGELALLDSRATLFARGQGQAVLIAGPAGIGKTTLLAAALGRERKPGRAVLAARGGELETELPYGVVRQLFERLITTAAPGERAQMLAGAAGLAEPVFAGKTHATSGEAVMHGLFWMAANIATERPLVIAIDDAHWADAASLRFASYLVRRLEGLAVLVLLCARTDEPVVPGSELDQLVNEPTIERVDVRPLSNAGVRAVVEAVFECVPDSEFVAACTRATAGNPFLLRALAGDLRASGVQPTAQCVGLVGDVGPDIVGHGALLRLARLHPVATRLAQAVAVLGADARLPRVAKLADLPNEEALRAVDALVAGGIIELGPPLAFTHPIIRTSVYRGIGTGERSLAHTRAAEQLAKEGAAADVVATHLLATEPIGGTKAVRALREGASDALARGAPESAVAFLRRALAEEPPRAVRADLLFELGMAENKIRRADSIDQLLEARRLMDDPVARGRCSLALGNILIWMGRAKESYEALRAGIADTEGTGDAIAIRLKAAYVSHGMYFASEVDQVDRMLESLRPLLDAGSLPPDSQVLVAGVDVMRGRDVDAAVTTIRHAIDHGQLLSELGAESDVLTAGLVALAFSDEVDAAEALLEAMTIDARVRGSAAGFLTTCGLRECVLWRRGDVAGAEDELRRALTLVKEHSLSLPLVFALYYGVDAMTERDGLADVVELAMGLELPPFLAETVTAAWLAEIRARLLLAKSERRAAVQALSKCEAVYERIPLQPSASAWRSLLALASAPEDPKRARDLAHTELDAAERVGQPRAIGIALCRLGLIEGGQLGIERLREGEARLRHSTARLEHARALVELGGALRRANRRADARKPLHEGMDLAYRCGASRLAERARTELRATGARPRRVMVSGRDALTPSERRIADLAAGGLSNPDIAQSLFVTSKTVENQLSRVYRKLAIGSRAELAEALAGEGAKRRSHP